MTEWLAVTVALSVIAAIGYAVLADHKSGEASGNQPERSAAGERYQRDRAD